MNPNLTQVAGTHYRSSFQHWDLVVKLRLGYFEGQVTKYVTRHRSKNGAQDLDKALHFLMKLMHLHQTAGWAPQHLHPTTTMMHEYQEANLLNDQEARVVFYVCAWSNLDGLKLAEQALMELTRLHYPRGLPAPVKRSDEERLAAIDGDMFRGVPTEYRLTRAGIEPVDVSLVKNPAPGCELKPCRSPYCECPVGQCSHPGSYDARGTAAPITAAERPEQAALDFAPTQPPEDDGGPGPGYVDQGRDI